MNTMKWIKQIIGKEAEKAGFMDGGSHRDGYVRVYFFYRTHEEEEYEDEIGFTVINNTIRMDFHRSGMGRGYIDDVTCLLESKFTSDIQGFIAFDSEEEYKEILEYFARIIREKSKEVFDSMEVFKEEDGHPGRGMHWKLYQEHEELNRKYRKLYGMEDTEFTANAWVMTISIMVGIWLVPVIGKKLQNGMISMENRDKKFEEVKELLIGLAAVYGNQLVLKGNGRWEWQEGKGGLPSHCWVKGIEGGSDAIPLSDLAFYWRGKRDEAETVRELLHKFPKGPHGVVI